MSNYIRYEAWDGIIYISHASTLKFGNGYVISFHYFTVHVTTFLCWDPSYSVFVGVPGRQHIGAPKYSHYMALYSLRWPFTTLLAKKICGEFSHVLRLLLNAVFARHVML